MTKGRARSHLLHKPLVQALLVEAARCLWKMVELCLGEEYCLETRQAERYVIPAERHTEITECLCRIELHA